MPPSKPGAGDTRAYPPSVIMFLSCFRRAELRRARSGCERYTCMHGVVSRRHSVLDTRLRLDRTRGGGGLCSYLHDLNWRGLVSFNLACVVVAAVFFTFETFFSIFDTILVELIFEVYWPGFCTCGAGFVGAANSSCRGKLCC